MRLGIFTDSHYSSAELTCGNRYNSKSLEKIETAFRHFKNENCDLVVCLGDLIDRENCHSDEAENLKKVARIMNGFDIKASVLMGNHDAFSFDEDEFYAVLGEKYRPENIISDGKNLIFLDTCYFASGIHYRPGDSDWTDAFYPQTDELYTYLEQAKGNVYVFLHHNIDPSVRRDHRIFNDEALREMFERSGKVKGIFQGHYHPGLDSTLNGICYTTFPAMCENENAFFVVEI